MKRVCTLIFALLALGCTTQAQSKPSNNVQPSDKKQGTANQGKART
jgi:hypothetical protein